MTWPAEITLTAGPITPVQLALFAAASGDHNPLHLDPDVARRAGFERPLVHGMLTMALAGRLFTQHLGAGCVRQLHTRFTGVALVGSTITLTATLEREEDDCAYYALRGTATGSAAVVSEVVTGNAVIERPSR